MPQPSEAIVLRQSRFAVRVFLGVTLLVFAVGAAYAIYSLALGLYYVTWLTSGYLSTPAFKDKPTLWAIWQNFGSTVLTSGATLAATWLAWPTLWHHVRNRPTKLTIGPGGFSVEALGLTQTTPWNDIASIDVVTVHGTPLIGMKVRNSEKFLADCKSLRPRETWFVGLARVMAQPPIVSKLFDAVGYPLPPPMGDMEGMLIWIRKRFGFDIVLLKSSFDDFDGVAERLKAGFAAAKLSQLDTALDVATKTCPVCAEQIKAAAKICRFCRHEFVSPSV
jgi:hypothetical protein